MKNIKELVYREDFTGENLKNKSTAAAGVCEWIKNIYMYYDVVVNVEPKKIAVAQSQEQLAVASEKKATSEALVKELNERLAVLMSEYNEAMAKKKKAEDTAAYCAERLDRANRLVGALGTEKDRWANSIITLGQEIDVVLGDVLIASAFVSYVGPFSKKFRELIIEKKFLKFFSDNKIPCSPNIDPLKILADEAQIAQWCNDKLPSDMVSVQNGAILVNSERYPLMIDPQLQGIVWIKRREAENKLQVTRLSNPKFVKTIELSLEAGNPVLLENLENSIDAVIQPVYARAIIKKGKNKYIKMGDSDIPMHPNFKLFMHTKLQNPHYPPEIQAECALINFSVTETGLEDQILSLVVKKERPDLAAKREQLIQDQNNFKITLRTMEATTLRQLKEQSGDILDDLPLIENLENSKKVSAEVKEKVAIAVVTEAAIKESSEAYRPAANRGALVFFLMNELFKIHSFYRFSLDSFVIVVSRAIDIVADRLNPKKEAPAEGEEGAAVEEDPEDDEELELTPRSLKNRVDMITDQITFEGFSYTRRGTREAHKLIIATMLTLRINMRKQLIKESEVNALIKKNVAMDPPQQIENLKFIPETNWAACKGLETVGIFANLIQSMEQEALQWKKWYADEKAESCELPKSYRDISLFHRILLLRALRPDRLSAALVQYVTESLGVAYVEQPAFDPFIVYDEMSVKTPAFFVLYPGVDPTPDVERVGQKYNKSLQDKTFLNISMGQGQENLAIQYLESAAKNGNWVMVQNVHLMTDWMKEFERKLEIAQENDPHPDFRCFISSEPPPLDDMEIIPESILQNAIKVSNEAPTNLKANMRRAISKFDEEYYERAKSHKYNEFKALIFGLCMFHSLILGRRKFGCIGWSRIYNFNDGDLTICGDILHNYLSKFEKVPYEDLKYLFGDIMYGGHITDNWDRRTNTTYLQVLIRPDIMTQMQLTLYPGFRSPDPARFERINYVNYIEEKLPTEVPAMFGLHANAEIGYLTNLGEQIFNIILRLQGAGSSAGKKGGDVVKEVIDKILNSLPDNFNMIEITGRYTELTPYLIVSLQEIERMNTLLGTIRFSLVELNQGLSGALNITDAMEVLQYELGVNKMPSSWVGVAYPSLKSLSEWYADLLLRINQLTEWSEAAETPSVLWISGLFNPMSYLTAIMQVTSREKMLPLDDIVLRTVVINKMNPDEIKNFAPEGAYIYGFFLEGADWEMGRGDEQGYLIDQTLKELHPVLPIMHVTAIQRKNEQKIAIYQCPVYVTSIRGAVYVFTAGLQLESEDQDVKKWILSGTALLMSPE